MKIQGFETNDVMIKEIGKRLKARRIALDITQKDLAVESGVSQRTISGFENGENITLDNLLSILRVLRLLQEINLLFPERKVNPFDVLNLGHSKKRASSKHTRIDSSWEWEKE
ncbi:MAG: XRE family transcriptional regulator [Acholeplasmatales bacterium]|nr:MAG: XRE family transcriptional regulator [Acholeplasmatales bacterium]